jgi:hypothetical protein
MRSANLPRLEAFFWHSIVCNLCLCSLIQPRVKSGCFQQLVKQVGLKRVTEIRNSNWGYSIPSVFKKLNEVLEGE